MLRQPSLTGAELLGVSAAVVPASTVVAAYLVDRAGEAFTPALILLFGFACGAAVLLLLRKRAEWHALDTWAFVAVVAAIFGWLLWIAAPSFLPLGSGSDLTHHLLLIRYIEEHWQLVHDPALEVFLGEMASYTPGSHVLAALAGAVSRSNGFHAVHAMVAATVALKAGFVYAIASRMLAPYERPSRPPIVRIAFAVLAGVVLFASQVYFLRSFVENSFIAQVVSELFAVVMWWTVTAWDERPAAFLAALFGLAGAAAFLTWPVWIGPPTLAALAIWLSKRDVTIAKRVLHLAAAIAPVGLAAGLYLAGRGGALGMAATGGAAPQLAAANYAGWFLVLSCVGLALAAICRPARTAALLAAAIVLQSAALFIVASRSGADAPYLALKMLYLLLYPQAVAAAFAVATMWSAGVSVIRRWAPAAPDGSRTARLLRVLEPGAACVLVALIAAIVFRPLAGAPRSLTVLRHPAVSAPLERAGVWARGHVPPACVEYLVDDEATAYWLHLAVLGNPRLSPRSIDSQTFKPGLAIVRWLNPGGLPYAIVDLPSLPRGVRDELDIVRQFGTAAVARRRDAAPCGEPR